MNSMTIALHLLKKRAASNCLLLVVVLVSIVMLSQVFVFLMDQVGTIRAVSELPAEDTYVLHRFDYYEPDEVLSAIQASPSVEACGTVRMGQCQLQQQPLRAVIYHNALTARYQPELQTGTWFDPQKTGTDIPVVVSRMEGAYAGKACQMILPGGQAVNVRIIGILADPTQYLSPSGAASPRYFSASQIIGNDPVAIFSEDFLPPEIISHWRNLSLSDNFLIFSGPSCPPSDEIQSQWNRFGELSRMRDLVDHYQRDSRRKLLTGTTTLFVFMLLSISSILCSDIIQMDQNQTRFTIYYLLGMTQKRAAMIELYRTAALILCMTALMFLAGRCGLLMLQWTTPARRFWFYGIAIVYVMLIFGTIDGVFIRRLAHGDLSEKLQALQQGE